MNYLIIGAGGTGGCIGGYLKAAGRDVTLVARGAHLKAIRENGLTLHGTRMGELHLKDIQAVEQPSGQKADVIFVCVKGYSIEGIIPLLKNASHKNTIIIPILNIVGMGGRLAELLPELTILDGCIYVSAYISAPGEVTQTGAVFRMIFGEREGNAHAGRLNEIAEDLRVCSMDVTVSDDIRRDAFRKFMFVSPFAAAGAYYDVTATEMQSAGESFETFLVLVRELKALAQAQGFGYDVDMEQDAIKRISLMEPGTTASMQKDLKKGGESEIDGLIFEVVRMAQRLGVEVPMYRKLAVHFGMIG